MDNLLEIRGLQIELPRGKNAVKLLDTVDLDVRKKQSFGIVGESGCGKSIMVNTLLQLLPYPLRTQAGTARFDAQGGELELISLPPEKIRRIRGREIAMIFQEPMTCLDPIFTIEFQMREAIEFHTTQSHHSTQDKKEQTERCVEMLRRVNIPRPKQTLASYPHELSGGQLQRVMIAIALINNPRLLIADEPTTALDVTIQAQILEVMNELKEERDTSIIMITHDLGVIAETCDEVAVFYAGEVVERAPVVALFHETAHPYTLGLLHAVTSMGAVEVESDRTAGVSRQLYTIPGMVPSGGEWSKGCRFAGRCDKRMPRCDEEHPALAAISPQSQSGGGHLCRCFRSASKATV
ncbi:MAG: ABC transporter ATP-binding protein [Treponema sp.]|jgi:peptide/nickel transport system ATP-binding protein|nr:ABC transporter ATP-binding protein [Treponema sp.]